MCGLSARDDEAGRDRIRIASGSDGIERLQAHLHGQAFSIHRHDTYAVGLTVLGVQSFRFRGQRWHCLPGQCHILHPDEPHDGGTETATGFGYRMIYVDPSLVLAASGGRSLPFVAHPVIDATTLRQAPVAEIWDFADDLDDIGRTELALAVLDLLRAASSRAVSESRRLDLARIARVRDVLIASPAQSHAMNELEQVAELDRWTLARQFRAAFGTSPSRFRTLRRLDRVRQAVRRGMGLTEAALEAGFADQSHMSRQFKRAYGLTPAKWAAMLL